VLLLGQVGWIGLNLMYLVLLVRLLGMDMEKKLNMMLLLGYLLSSQEVGMGNFVVAVVGVGGGVDDAGGGDGGGDHLLHP